MTRQQIVESLEDAEVMAAKIVKIIHTAASEIRAPECADWGRLEAGLALAMEGLTLLSETTPASCDSATKFTLHDVHHELIRRAVDAANPESEEAR